MGAEINSPLLTPSKANIFARRSAAVIWGITMGGNIGLNASGLATQTISLLYKLEPTLSKYLPPPGTVNEILDARIPIIIAYAAASYIGVRLHLYNPRTYIEAGRRVIRHFSRREKYLNDKL